MQIISELTLSKDLIKFPSITPVDAGAIKFLSKKLKSFGLTSTSRTGAIAMTRGAEVFK